MNGGKLGMKTVNKTAMVFFAGLLLLGTVFAAGETIDMNGVAIVSSSAKVSEGDFEIWVSAGEIAVGSISGDDYNVNLGFAYDTMGPVTTAAKCGDYNKVFTCTDDESNCKTLSYSLYDVNYFVEWSGPGAEIGIYIIRDGNHAIYYYSSDHSDNNETGKVTYCYRPAPVPHTTGGLQRTSPSRPPPEIEELFELKNFYVQLEDPSIPVLDGTEKDVGLKEKRFAGSDEVVLDRVVKAFALMGQTGAIEYVYKVVLEVENISGKELFGVELIEAIPKDIVENVSMIKSTTDFEVIEADPILRFLFNDLQPWDKKSIEYDFNRTAAQGPVSKEMFNEMTAPTALIELKPADKCLGVSCNDFNPCTRDYCVVDKCVYAQMKNGAKCGNDNVCMEGICVGEKVLVGQASLTSILATNFDFIIVIVLFGAVAIGFTEQFTASKFLKKKTKKIKDKKEKKQT